MRTGWIVITAFIMAGVFISIANSEQPATSGTSAKTASSTATVPSSNASSASTSAATAKPAATASAKAASPAPATTTKTTATTASKASAASTAPAKGSSVDTAAAAADKSGFDRFRDWFHNPTSWLSQTADLRVRYTYGYNFDTYNKESTRNRKWNWYQNRVRYGQKFKISDDIEFNMREVWEFRVWDSPPRKNGNGSSLEKRVHGTDFSEIIFDQFNLTMRNLGGMPLTMVAGRQDIIFGEGWLVFDGTPLDAARTQYFDALRFTYDLPGHEKTTLDMIVIGNKGAENAYLEPINDRHRFTQEQDELGTIIYYTDRSRASLNIEGYFIFKHDDPVGPSNVRAYSGYDNLPPFYFRKATIYTFGGALSGSVFGSEHWKYRSEGAIQFGEKQAREENNWLKMDELRSMQAFGTVNKLEYLFNDKHKNKLRGCFEFLSGDRPGTERDEGFDILWGRWPRFSELMAYSYTLESRVGDYTNLYRLGLGHSIQLTDKISIDTDLNWMWADTNSEKNRQPANKALIFSDNGKYRGTLLTSVLKYKITKDLMAHFWFEYFMPGDYYTSQSRSPAYFTRVNLDYTF